MNPAAGPKESRVPPVRIKYLGFIPLTRRAYLTLLAVAALALAVLLGIATYLGRPPSWQFPWDPSLDRWGLWPRIYNWWVIFAALAMEGLEVMVTLRQFAKKEAEQRNSVANKKRSLRSPA
jgi:hypothetical protein